MNQKRIIIVALVFIVTVALLGLFGGGLDALGRHFAASRPVPAYPVSFLTVRTLENGNHLNHSLYVGSADSLPQKSVSSIGIEPIADREAKALNIHVESDFLAATVNGDVYMVVLTVTNGKKQLTNAIPLLVTGGEIGTVLMRDERFEVLLSSKEELKGSPTNESTHTN